MKTFVDVLGLCEVLVVVANYHLKCMLDVGFMGEVDIVICSVE